MPPRRLSRSPFCQLDTGCVVSPADRNVTGPWSCAGDKCLLQGSFSAATAVFMGGPPVRPNSPNTCPLPLLTGMPSIPTGRLPASTGNYPDHFGEPCCELHRSFEKHMLNISDSPVNFSLFPSFSFVFSDFRNEIEMDCDSG